MSILTWPDSENIKNYCVIIDQNINYHQKQMFGFKEDCLEDKESEILISNILE